MHIKGFQELTLTDWPGVIASIIFLGGCNLRCFYCHNFELAFFPERIEDISEDLVFERLKEKKDWIEGVVISGGEPTIYGEKLKELIVKLKQNGFKVKLFTNGTSPSLIKDFFKLSLLDAISIDIKHAPGKYNLLMRENMKDVEKYVWETVEFVKNYNVEKFFRTTVIKNIHTIEDIIAIKKIVSPYRLYLQNVHDKGVFEDYKDMILPFTQQEFDEMKSICN
jgi:pyruvate formate lyase activating enzyme